MANKYQGYPVIISTTGKRVEYHKRPKRYAKSAVEDIRNYLARPLGIFGRERKKQERLMRTGELLGMMPEEASRHIYQKVFPFNLKRASVETGKVIKISMPNGRELTIKKGN